MHGHGRSRSSSNTSCGMPLWHARAYSLTLFASGQHPRLLQNFGKSPATYLRVFSLLILMAIFSLNWIRGVRKLSLWRFLISWRQKIVLYSLWRSCGVLWRQKIESWYLVAILCVRNIACGVFESSNLVLYYFVYLIGHLIFKSVNVNIYLSNL